MYGMLRYVVHLLVSQSGTEQRSTPLSHIFFNTSRLLLFKVSQMSWQLIVEGGVADAFDHNDIVRQSINLRG